MIHLRTGYFDRVQEAFESLPIVVLIGARQVGKTTMMKNFPLSGATLFLDGQDPEVAVLFEKRSVIEQYLRVNLNANLDGYLLLDEFQFINNISTMLKLLTDHNPSLKVLCSGSSGIEILQNVAESLAGRVRVIPVFSLSFSEYLMFNDQDLFETYKRYDVSTDDQVVDNRMLVLLQEYLVYGGLPRVAIEKKLTRKIDLLDDVYKTYLLKDVRSFVKNSDFTGFNKLLKLLSAQTGSMVNVNNLSRDCGLTYKKTEEYLYILEQMYIIKLVEPYFTNTKKVITKMKKVYFTDLGLRNIVYGDFRQADLRTDSGNIFENFVLLEMLRKIKNAHKLYYYRTLDGSEVDFVVDNMHEKISIEVKFKNYEEPKNMRNLNIFNSAENVERSFVINRNLNSKDIKTHYLQAYLVEKINFEAT
jgi:uncharacterized protein